MPRIQTFIIFFTVLLLNYPTARAQWTVQESGTKARLRGLSVVSAEVAWASGAGGTYLRTIDGGKTWHSAVVPGAEMLDFRDVDAVDGKTAYLLSIGEGDKSRILKTTDGGKTWTTLYVNPDPKGFLDAIAFRDADHGLVFGDPVGQQFVAVRTDDGGKTWRPTSPERMPVALRGEGVFAASGTCAIALANGHLFVGTGGAEVSRVFRSPDMGKTWSVHECPVEAGVPSAGIFSLAFFDAEHGVAIGGDYMVPERAADRVALTSDGGRTWRLPTGPQPTSFRSAVAYVPGTRGRVLIAVGPTGSDISGDEGESWRRISPLGFHALGFAGSSGWAVGENGSIAKFEGLKTR